MLFTNFWGLPHPSFRIIGRMNIALTKENAGPPDEKSRRHPLTDIFQCRLSISISLQPKDDSSWYPC